MHCEGRNDVPKFPEYRINVGYNRSDFGVVRAYEPNKISKFRILQETLEVHLGICFLCSRHPFDHWLYEWLYASASCRISPSYLLFAFFSSGVWGFGSKTCPHFAHLYPGGLYGLSGTLHVPENAFHPPPS